MVKNFIRNSDLHFQIRIIGLLRSIDLFHVEDSDFKFDVKYFLSINQRLSDVRLNAFSLVYVK